MALGLGCRFAVTGRRRLGPLALFVCRVSSKLFGASRLEFLTKTAFHDGPCHLWVDLSTVLKKSLRSGAITAIIRAYYLPTEKSCDRKSPQYQLRKNLSNRIYKAIKEQDSSKDYKTMHLTGCPILQLIKYLESQFEPGMSWENYGQKGWHVDHVKPCASFNLVDPEEQKKCFHYSNLQPLWAQDNLSKGCKINWNKPSCNTHLESSSPLSLP